MNIKPGSTKELEAIWSAAYALQKAMKDNANIPAQYKTIAAGLSRDLFGLTRSVYYAEEAEKVARSKNLERKGR